MWLFQKKRNPHDLTHHTVTIKAVIFCLLTMLDNKFSYSKLFVMDNFQTHLNNFKQLKQEFYQILNEYRESLAQINNLAEKSRINLDRSEEKIQGGNWRRLTPAIIKSSMAMRPYLNSATEICKKR